MTPTEELYSALQSAYDHFNDTLFDKALPLILFTIQRQHGIMGYFAPNRWASSNGKNCHEIAINPLYVGKATLIELMQTLVHEMTHCWQHCYGKPGRPSYHNQEWSDKMVSIGLMPSSTGKPGGKRTGQKMNDYPIPHGAFVTECVQLLNNNFNLPWVDRFSVKSLKPVHDITESISDNSALMDALNGIDNTIISQLTTCLNNLFGHDAFFSLPVQSIKKVKSKYTCHECGVNVWGKSNLSLRCEDCDYAMQEN